MSYLEPVYSTAVDEGGKHAEAVAEWVADRGEAENEVEIASSPLDELVVHIQGSEFHLFIFSLTNYLHL